MYQYGKVSSRESIQNPWVSVIRGNDMEDRLKKYGLGYTEFV